MSRERAAIGAAVFISYAFCAAPHLLHPSTYPHYVYLAQAFLHGQLHLVTTPVWLHDYAAFDGKLFVQQGPLPGVLMMPLVALFGLQASDVFLTVAVGALNAVLVHRVLAAAQPEGNRAVRIAVTLLFAWGTPHWYLSVTGRVWHAASVCALACLLLGVQEMFTRTRPWRAGLWLGLAFLGRPSLLAASAFFLWRLWGRGARRIAEFLLPVLASVAVWMLYNAERFGHPLETGFSYLAAAPTLYADGMRYGLFHPHFVPQNLWYALLNGFHLQRTPPFLVPDPFGNGLFVVTPAFLLIFHGAALSRRCLSLWAGLGGIFVLLMGYMWTGWTQFGFRYLVDAMPFLALLTQAGMGRRVSRPAAALIAASIAVNWVGLRWFQANY